MLVMFVANNLWPPIVTDQLCVTVTAYSVSDEHLYFKQQQEPSATTTTDVMTLETNAQMLDDGSNADRMDTDSDVSSLEQTINCSSKFGDWRNMYQMFTRAMLCTRTCPSIRSSVCHSRYCIKTVKRIVHIFSPPDNPIISRPLSRRHNCCRQFFLSVICHRWKCISTKPT